MYGYNGFVEGLVRRFRAELEELYNSTEIRVKVIATGGLAEIVSEGAPGIIDVVDQDLTLQGLRLIHELNG